jgi:hypothetical protein
MDVNLRLTDEQLRELAILWLRYADLDEIKGNVENELEARFVMVYFDTDEWDEPYES